MRHILGEDLNVGCVLSWGPCWYSKSSSSRARSTSFRSQEYLMRYDVEVSGFPSSALRASVPAAAEGRRLSRHHAHRRVADLGPAVLKWGKEQGGVVGFSHSGWGLAIKEPKLPNYEMPPFDGIGANEFIVDVSTTCATSSRRSIRRSFGS